MGHLPRSNAYGSVSHLAMDLTPDTPEDRASLRARYAAVPGHVDAQIHNLEQGLEQGLVANAVSVDKVISQIRTELEKPVHTWPMWQAVSEVPTDPEASPDAQAELDAHAAEISRLLEQEILPAFERYVRFLETEVRPRARASGSEGLGALPGGDRCYAGLVRRYTTLDVSADDRHQRGLDELKSIHAEFRALGAKALGTDDLQAIFSRLRTDPALHFETEQEVEDKARSALAKAQEAMPDWFGRTPRRECLVERVPDHEAPYTTIAYYRRPTPRAPRPLLHQRVPAHDAPPPRGRGPGVPRVHPGAPPADRHQPGAATAPGLPEVRRHDRVRRGMGAVHRAPGR